MNLDFGEALHALRRGRKVARAGWNGKGMWLTLIPNEGVVLEDSGLRLLPWIGMRTADAGFVPWLASQTDVLASDWIIVE